MAAGPHPSSDIMTSAIMMSCDVPRCQDALVHLCQALMGSGVRHTAAQLLLALCEVCAGVVSSKERNSYWYNRCSFLESVTAGGKGASRDIFCTQPDDYMVPGFKSSMKI